MPMFHKLVDRFINTGGAWLAGRTVVHRAVIEQSHVRHAPIVHYCNFLPLLVLAFYVGLAGYF